VEIPKVKSQNIFHDSLIRKVLESLNNIFIEGRFADKVVEFHLKQSKRFGSRDRKLYAEAVYEIVRWWRKIYEISGGTWSDDLKDFSSEEFEQIVANWLSLKDMSFKKTLIPAADEDFVQRWQTAKLSRASRESIPDWLDAKGANELSKDWEKWLSQLNREAPVYLRTNTLLGTAKDLRKDLLAEGFETDPASEVALLMRARGPLFRTKAFAEGRFEMQDLHSQKVCELLNPQPGARVVDACAGAGGKTLHLAAMMKNRGQIIALDIHEPKLVELKRRARRAKISIVETRLIESTKVIKRLHESADFVLLDVPCSGSGVLKRNPDSKWKLSVQECEELSAIQADILDRYSRLVKPGGALVYSTCSIFPSENQQQVQKFLKAHGDFKLVSEMTLPPTPGDGFYAAKFSKQ